MSEGQHPGVFTKRNTNGNKWKYTKYIKIHDFVILFFLKSIQSKLHCLSLQVARTTTHFLKKLVNEKETFPLHPICRLYFRVT